MKAQIADNITEIKSKFQLSDKNRWTLILGEFAVLSLLIFVSIYQSWPIRDYLRFFIMLPLYHAGATFGYAGSIPTSLLTLFLFAPIIPINAYDPGFQLTIPSSIVLLVFFVAFGNAVGGTVGEARKNRKYIENLSQVFMGIFSESHERTVMLRAYREASLLTEADGGDIMMRAEGKSDPENWPLIRENLLHENQEKNSELPTDSVLVWSARENAAIVSNRAASDPRLSLGTPAENIRSLISVPVSFEDSTYGAILLTNKKNGENFTKRDFSIAKAIAETAGGAIHNMVHEKERQEEKIRAEQMRELFSKYVSSSVADYVLEHPDLLEGRWQEVTILVSDIRDFTSMSEKVGARELVAQLNEYFTSMVDVVFENKGTIDKFIGDCIVAYWGAPAPDPQHAANAIRAAEAMSRSLDNLNNSWAARGMTPISAGIAIHTCSVLMGNIGDDRKKAFTIMGEEVDKAIGIESLTKTAGKRIIISETACRASGLPLSEIDNPQQSFGKLYTLTGEFE